MARERLNAGAASGREKRGIRARDVIACAVFCLILCVTLMGLNSLCYDDETVCTTWDRIAKGDGPDLLIMGNSHAFTSLIPDIISQSTGISCGTLGSSSEIMPLTLENLRTVLSVYTPRMILLEAHPMMNNTDAYLNAKSAILGDIDGMPALWNRLRSTQNMLGLDDLPLGISQLFQPAYTWTRWNRAAERVASWGKEETSPPFDQYDVRGFRFRNNYTGGTVSPDKIAQYFIEAYENAAPPPASALEPWSEKSFVQFLKLAQQHDIPVMIYKSPILSESRATVNAMRRIRAIAEDYPCCVFVEDTNASMNRMDLALSDFYDNSHLNRRGAVKFTTWFLNEKLIPNQPEPDYSQVFFYQSESVEPLGDDVYRYRMTAFGEDVLYRFRLDNKIIQDWSNVNHIDVALDPEGNGTLRCEMVRGDVPPKERSKNLLNLRFMKQNASFVGEE